VKFRSSWVPALLAFTFAAGSAYAQTANVSQNVTLDEKLQIPGASLKPGEYTFSVEDRLQDRAIVRITSQDQSKHFLVLTVPNGQMGQPGSDALVLFTNASGRNRALRGWACPACSPGLEFVYPKAEAAKLTDETGEAVLAVDPTYDKLPGNLSADDMKVVTLWLLSPERVTAGNKGKGVKAEKYAGISRPSTGTQRASANSSEIAQSPAPTEQAATAPVVNSASTAAVSAPPSSTSEVAQAPAVAPAPAAAPAPALPAQPTDVASASSTPPTPAGRRRGRLPKTASDDYLYLFGGMLLMLAALGVGLSRGRVAVSRS
jgi:LPXTG-motif cell wall-anchored protein